MISIEQFEDKLKNEIFHHENSEYVIINGKVHYFDITFEDWLVSYMTVERLYNLYISFPRVSYFDCDVSRRYNDT